jgi:plastocyanin domain-containing protein
MPKIFAALAAAAALITSSAAFAAEPQSLQVAITDNGVEPSTLTAKAGQPVKLVITRKTDATCITKVVSKDLGVDKDLPKDKPVTIEVTPSKPGTYRLACGMGMTFASVKAQ